MRKLMIGAAVAAAVFGMYRWQQPAAVEPDLVANRLWIDHMPANERDPYHAFAVFPRAAQGAFAVQSRWHTEVERFRFEAEGEALRAVFPWSGDREQLTVRAWRCDEQDMDYCLEITGSKRGVQKYYSRNGWERRAVDDVDALRVSGAD